MSGGSTRFKKLGARSPFGVKNGKKPSPPETGPISDKLAAKPIDWDTCSVF